MGAEVDGMVGHRRRRLLLRAGAGRRPAVAWVIKSPGGPRSSPLRVRTSRSPSTCPRSSRAMSRWVTPWRSHCPTSASPAGWSSRSPPWPQSPRSGGEATFFSAVELDDPSVAAGIDDAPVTVAVITDRVDRADRGSGGSPRCPGRRWLCGGSRGWLRHEAGRSRARLLCRRAGRGHRGGLRRRQGRGAVKRPDVLHLEDVTKGLSGDTAGGRPGRSYLLRGRR